MNDFRRRRVQCNMCGIEVAPVTTQLCASCFKKDYNTLAKDNDKIKYRTIEEFLKETKHKIEYYYGNLIEIYVCKDFLSDIKQGYLKKIEDKTKEECERKLLDWANYDQ